MSDIQEWGMRRLGELYPAERQHRMAAERKAARAIRAFKAYSKLKRAFENNEYIENEVNGKPGSYYYVIRQKSILKWMKILERYVEHLESEDATQA
jgi:hypothetical protein